MPENTILDLDQINKTLWKQAEDDHTRLHYEKNTLQSKLYEEDRESWRKLKVLAISLSSMK